MNGIFDLSNGMLGQEVLWGIPLWRLGLALIVIFLGFLSRKILSMVFEGKLKHKVGRTRIQWDDDLMELMPAPIALIVQIVIWYIAAIILQIPQEPIDIRAVVYKGLEVAIAIALLWVGLRLIDVAAKSLARLSNKTETKLDDQAVPLLRKTLKVFIAVVVIVMIVQNLGYSVTSVIASLGVGGLALALAAKDMVANFFGSVVIFTDSPFQIGDWVQFGSVEGTIEEVGFRTTRIRRFDKALVVVPNQVFTTSPITNYSNRAIRRIKMTVGVSYETTPQKMQQLLTDLNALLSEHPELDQSFHFAHFVEFGDSSLNIQIYCFTKTAVWTDFLEAREDLMLKIMQRIDQLGLEIAFPTRTVYLRDEQWPSPGQPTATA